MKNYDLKIMVVIILGSHNIDLRANHFFPTNKLIFEELSENLRKGFPGGCKNIDYPFDFKNKIDPGMLESIKHNFNLYFNRLVEIHNPFSQLTVTSFFQCSAGFGGGTRRNTSK